MSRMSGFSPKLWLWFSQLSLRGRWRSPRVRSSLRTSWTPSSRSSTWTGTTVWVTASSSPWWGTEYCAASGWASPSDHVPAPSAVSSEYPVDLLSPDLRVFLCVFTGPVSAGRVRILEVCEARHVKRSPGGSQPQQQPLLVVSCVFNRRESFQPGYLHNPQTNTTTT